MLLAGKEDATSTHSARELDFNQYTVPPEAGPRDLKEKTQNTIFNLLSGTSPVGKPVTVVENPHHFLRPPEEGDQLLASVARGNRAAAGIITLDLKVRNSSGPDKNTRLSILRARKCSIPVAESEKPMTSPFKSERTNATGIYRFSEVSSQLHTSPVHKLHLIFHYTRPPDQAVAELIHLPPPDDSSQLQEVGQYLSVSHPPDS